MISKGCFVFKHRRLISQDYEIPLLTNQKKRKVKSRDDAYSTDNILVFNDNHLPITKQTTLPYWEKIPYTNIQCGENHILLGISTDLYDDIKWKLERKHDIQSLYLACHTMASTLTGSIVENISWKELSRKQVNKDLMREHVIINQTPFEYYHDIHALKLFLLEKINTFSRGNLASLAIMRHMLGFFSRTENSGDAFSVIRHLLPPSILITTVITSTNPVIVSIEPSSHVTVDTLTILRITPDYPPSFLSRLTKPLFTTSHHPLEGESENSDSFILVCLLRTSIFYMTGDLQSVDIQRHIYLKTLTNKRFQNTLNLYQLFNLPSFHTPSDGIKPIYYDINCTFQDLHLTVSFEFDKNDREILVISEIERSHPIHPNIKVGHILVSIGGISLQGIPHEEAIRIIRQTPRPCILRVYYIPYTVSL